MTIRSLMATQLEEKGLFPDQAEEVLVKAEQSDLLKSMTERWNDAVSDYDKSLHITTWISVKRIASEWIAENMPEAWFRPLFA